jgi:hypothetical protein
VPAPSWRRPWLLELRLQLPAAQRSPHGGHPAQ